MEKATATPGEIFDQVIAWAASKQTGPASIGSPPRRVPTVPLRLRTEPRVVHRPEMVRDIAAIDPQLRKKIRAVVTGESPWPLFVTGLAGRGKTCAALCLLDHAGGEYYSAGRLCEDLILAAKGQLSWGVNGQRENLTPFILWQRITRAPLMVLDEIGARNRVSDFAYETVQRVLDDRHGKPLVCISNLDPARLAQLYDDRIVSRLAAGTVFHLTGEDRRLA